MATTRACIVPYVETSFVQSIDICSHRGSSRTGQWSFEQLYTYFISVHTWDTITRVFGPAIVGAKVTFNTHSTWFWRKKSCEVINREIFLISVKVKAIKFKFSLPPFINYYLSQFQILAVGRRLSKFLQNLFWWYF